MKTNAIILLMAALFAVACASSHKVSKSWLNAEYAQKSYKKVFIAVLTDDVSAKLQVESALADKLEKNGVAAVKSTDVFSPGFKTTDGAPKEELLKVIKETGSDAIFTLALLDVVASERYEPPYVYPAPGPFLFYGGFYDYYSFRYPVLYQPGYHTEDKLYLIESNLYDAESEKLVWTVQSSSYNPATLNSWFKGYVKMMVNQMKKDGLLTASTGNR